MSSLINYLTLIMIELEKLVTCKLIGIKDLNVTLLSYNSHGFFLSYDISDIDMIIDA